MKRIRLMSIAVLISLLLSATGGAMAEQIASIEELPEWPILALSGEGVWVISEGQAQYAAAYSEVGMKTVTGLGAVTAAAADGMGLYTYPNDPENPTLQLHDVDGVLISSVEIPDTLELWHIRPMEDAVVLLASPPNTINPDDSYHGHDLYLLDRETGKLSDRLMEMAMDIAPTEDGQLLVMHWHEGFSTATDLMNLETGQRTQIQDGSGGNYDGLSYAGPGKIYLLGATGTLLYDTATGKNDLVFEPSRDFIWGSMDSLGPIFAAVTDQGIKVYDLSKQPETDSALTIINCYVMDSRMEAVRDWFKQAHPNVKISTQSLDYDQLHVAVMAGDTGYDMLVLDHTTYDAFARQGALISLSESASINESLEAWMPGVCDPLTVDGILYGLPSDIYADMISIDGPAYRASGVDWPKDQSITWADLIPMAEAAGVGGPDKPPLYADDFYYPWSMWQYTSWQTREQGYVDFDTPLFRELMETHKQLIASGAMVEATWEDPRNGAVASLGSWYSSRDEDVECRMLPTLNGEMVIPVQPFTLSVNRASEHVPLAMEFLERYAMPETQNHAFYVNLTDLLLKDISGYTKFEFFDDPDYTAEDLAYREMVLSNWVPQAFYYEFREYCLDGVMQDYLDDKIDIEQLIRLLQAKIDMVQME